jgi:hypothetical protein
MKCSHFPLSYLTTHISNHSIVHTFISCYLKINEIMETDDCFGFEQGSMW